MAKYRVILTDRTTEGDGRKSKTNKLIAANDTINTDVEVVKKYIDGKFAGENPEGEYS